MKLKLNLLHKVGAAALAAGIAVLAAGLVMMYKSTHLHDISDLKAEDIKSGMYVKGTISDVVRGFMPNPDATDNTTINEPLDICTTVSEETSDEAYASYVLIPLGTEKEEFVCLLLDQFLYPDFYYQVMTGNSPTNSGESVNAEFEGIVTKCSKTEKQLMEKRLDNWQKDYSHLCYERYVLGNINSKTIPPYVIKCKDMSKRKYYWLYSLPLFFMGGVLLWQAGSPIKKIK